jgi:hypothetical protein
MNAIARSVLMLGALLVSVGCAGKNTAAGKLPPAVYECRRADSPINLDGKLDDAAWQKAEWTSDFVDVRGEGWPRPRYRTRCKLLWDDTNLYIAAEVQDPDVWGTMTQKGSHLYEENNFEVFLDWQNNARDYWELEVNPLNTTWDLQLNRPLGEGGGPMPGKALAGLHTAVDVRGTLNNPADRDEGWTVEIVIPFASLATDQHVPRDGETWRMLLCRIEWSLFSSKGQYTRVPAGDQYWAWVPTGAIAYHLPDKYGQLRFER